MEIFRFFTAISPILLILRILTNQRLRKERSVHGACMGCILEGIEGLNYVETDSDLHKDSWRYSGFSLISMAEMGYVFRYNSTTRRRTPKRTTPSDSAHRIGLSTLLMDVLTVDEGVSGWGLKMAESGTFLLPLREPVAVPPNGRHHSIQRVEMVYSPARGKF